MGFRAVFTAVDGFVGGELWITDGTADGTVRLKDINPGINGSTPLGFYKIGNGKALFRTFLDESGLRTSKVWITDGTGDGTFVLKDTAPGFINFPQPSEFTLLNNGSVLFSAFAPASGTELWLTDGTTAGTILLKDINTSSINTSNSNPRSFTDLGDGKVIFSAHNGQNGQELWITDATAGGTSLLRDINPAAGNSNPGSFTAIGNGKFIFTASDGMNGHELWITDGTAAGTALVKDINPGTGDSSLNPEPVPFTIYKAPFFTALGNGKLLFQANDGATGTELWITDGTTAGTRLVKDINPGTADSLPAFDKFTVLGDGTAIFTALDGTNGYELWITDGTTAGTRLLKDFYPGNDLTPIGNSGQPGGMTPLGNGTFVFRARDAIQGAELWITDGTAEGTSLLKDIYTGPVTPTVGSSNPGNFKNVGDGKVIFNATDLARGDELWITDGTTEGTLLVKDIFPGARGSQLIEPTVISDLAAPPSLFTANDDDVTLPTSGAIWNALAGNDKVIGTSRSDRILGGDGDDGLRGGIGRDTLIGNDGNDILIGDGPVSLSANAQSIRRLYTATLDRAPDDGGWINWTTQRDAGQSLDMIAAGFVGSTEFQTKYGALNNAQFVTQLYRNVLDREPDAAGLANAVNALDSNTLTRTQIVTGFSESAEFVSGTSTTLHAGQVYRLYGATLARAPDAGGFETWTDDLGGGRALVDIAAGFVNSSEFQAKYGNQDNTGFVTLLYQNVLGRAPDSGGLAFWTGQLDSGAQTRTQVVTGFSESGEYIAGTRPGVDAFMRNVMTAWSDTLTGGTGDDRLTGGRGSDRFAFVKSDGGADTVYGFESFDTLQLTGFGFADSTAALAAITQQGANAVLTYTGGSITFADTPLSVLQGLSAQGWVLG